METASNSLQNRQYILIIKCRECMVLPNYLIFSKLVFKGSNHRYNRSKRCAIFMNLAKQYNLPGLLPD